MTAMTDNNEPLLFWVAIRGAMVTPLVNSGTAIDDAEGEDTRRQKRRMSRRCGASIWTMKRCRAAATTVY
jgi:hypothetical protein